MNKFKADTFAHKANPIMQHLFFTMPECTISVEKTYPHFFQRWCPVSIKIVQYNKTLTVHPVLLGTYFYAY